MTLRTFTLDDLIRRNAVLYKDAPAFWYEDVSITHAQYAVRVAQLAAGLAQAGIEAGDRIVVLSTNSLEFCDLLGAAGRLGAILIPVSTRLAPNEVSQIIEDSEPSMLVVAPNLRHGIINPPNRQLRRFTMDEADNEWETFAALYIVGTLDSPAPIDDEAPLLFLYTAASNGHPRGAVLSHRGLLATAEQASHNWSMTPTDVFVATLPLYHLLGINLMLTTQLAGGSTLVLSKFNTASLAAQIDQYSGSLIGTFPPMLEALLDATPSSEGSLASLRVVVGIDTPEMISRLHAMAPRAAMWSCYGQTETSGLITMSPFSARPGSAGRPILSATVSIVDEDDKVVSAGATGEVVVRGPMVFRGYWRCDDDNAIVFRNGWHHTGDFGRLDDDGYLWYKGHLPTKELIKPGGENVYPAEVESLLRTHPGIADAVVFGVQDAQWGEAVAAVCVARPGATLRAEEIIEFVGTHIAHYKRPKKIYIIDTMPKNAAGIIDRAAIKRIYGGI